MGETVSGNDHYPTKGFSNIYKQWGQGGWGMILTGNVQVDPKHLGSGVDLLIDASRVHDAAYQKGWREYAQACQPAPVVMQINHPGRQSPMGAGSRGFFEKAVAPSAVALDLGPGLVARGLRALMFGTPRALTTAEVYDIIKHFVTAGKLAYDCGFQGVELHAAHGYLLAQFMAARTNLRTDEFGGSAAKRAEIAVRIIKGIREATSPSFAIGMKINSVDAALSGDTDAGFLEQVERFNDAGIDFLEVSGGTYEKPDMAASAPTSARTAEREAYFLTFSALIRENFPKIPLMVTGGFRSVAFMNKAVASKQVDLVGIGRPAALNTHIPRDIFDAKETSDLKLDAPKIPLSWPMSWIPVKIVGAGMETIWYGKKIAAMAL
ncbi:NADH:flavin oxidoreductase/NADH oxidase [Phlyctema vagabunda]|uniref:NADH:flavin oxidoreductase/NADH oxidase n=1 Tax=Phlyctema vagabunda TaxID=108571 RepID=A0ABR4PIC8_9HELO